MWKKSGNEASQYFKINPKNKFDKSQFWFLDDSKAC